MNFNSDQIMITIPGTYTALFIPKHHSFELILRNSKLWKYHLYLIDREDEGWRGKMRCLRSHKRLVTKLRPESYNVNLRAQVRKSHFLSEISFKVETEHWDNNQCLCWPSILKKLPRDFSKLMRSRLFKLCFSLRNLHLVFPGSECNATSYVLKDSLQLWCHCGCAQT